MSGLYVLSDAQVATGPRDVAVFFTQSHTGKLKTLGHRLSSNIPSFGFCSSFGAIESELNSPWDLVCFSKCFQLPLSPRRMSAPFPSEMCY